MPGCVACRMLVDGECSAFSIALDLLGRRLPPPPIGACMLPIVDEYLQHISPGMRVLEIGCGSWDRVRRHCESVGARFEGIDAEGEYFGRPTVATRVENLADLSFEDEHFDVVLGTQSMEHWAEHGCAVGWGLYQCFRVCKPGGKVFMNVPMHYHGTREFMLGQLGTLRARFAAFSNQVTFVEWGSPSSPIPECYPFPGYWRLRDRPAYVLDIRAVKDRPLPPRRRGEWAVGGRLAEALNYPVSFNVYRALRKSGLLP